MLHLKAMNKKRFTENRAEVLVDIIHLVSSAAVIVLAVLIFLYPDRREILYPVIFGMAALLNFTNIYLNLRSRSAGRGSLPQVIGFLIAGLFFLVLTILSTVSMMA